jgi:hypothetical protein
MMRIWDELRRAREIEKAGARFSAADQKTMQDIHDKVAGLCDKVHCAADPGEGANDTPGAKPGASEAGMLGNDMKTQKAGARHSAYDMLHMKSIHDCAVACGAKCF